MRVVLMPASSVKDSSLLSRQWRPLSCAVCWLLNQFVMNAFTEIIFQLLYSCVFWSWEWIASSQRKSFTFREEPSQLSMRQHLTGCQNWELVIYLICFFIKKLKLQKDKKSRKKKQSLSAFRENYQHWLKTRERN